MSEKRPEFLPTSSSLLCRLKDWDDTTSWQRFSKTYRNLIHDTARRAGLSEAEADDVVQDTLLSVAKKMQDFKYNPAQGSFKGWLLQLTHWRILNQFKKRLPTGELEPAGDDSSAASPYEELPDPASADMSAFWDAEWQKNLMSAAIERVKQTASPRQYEIFHLHVVKKLSAAAVAKTLNVSLPQVYLAKHRVTALVKKEVRRLEKEMI